MIRQGLADFITELENANELIRISQFVDPVLEIPEIVDRISKSTQQNKALLFENTATEFPLLINAMGSEKRMCMALNVNQFDEITHDIKSILADLGNAKDAKWTDKISLIPRLISMSKWMPTTKNGKGKCQQVINKNPNLNDLPILKCWPYDGGKFITLPIVHTLDPVSSNRNVGMYRMQQFSPNTTGLHWHLHKVSAKHFHTYKAQGLNMPVAVVLGGDPIYTYCATAPLPENIDEYILAGFLRKKRVSLVKCITQPTIEVPSDADIVLEGYIDTSSPLVNEGPFGDHTGYYSLEDLYPLFHLTAITHQENAVYPATIVGVPPQEDAWIGKATERIFLTPIQLTMMPELKDMCMPSEGTFHNLALFSIDKQFVGQAIKCMNTFWGAGQMMLNKVLVAFDAHHNIQQKSMLDILRQQLKYYTPSLHTVIMQGPLDVLDHSSKQKGFGGKLGIDLTTPLLEEQNDAYCNPSLSKLSISNIKKISTQIFDVNVQLIKAKLPILILSVNNANAISAIKNKLLKLKDFEGVKIIVFVDKEVNVKNISLVSWVVLNHIDPQRDTQIVEQNSKKEKHKLISFLFVDGTSKIKLKSFNRDWPNPVCSDEATIKKVDDLWDSLNLGPFIKSPSLDIIPLTIQEGSAYALKKSSPANKHTKRKSNR